MWKDTFLDTNLSFSIREKICDPSYLSSIIQSASVYATNLENHNSYCCNFYPVAVVIASVGNKCFCKADNYILGENDDFTFFWKNCIYGSINSSSIEARMFRQL